MSAAPKLVPPLESDVAAHGALARLMSGTVPGGPGPAIPGKRNLRAAGPLEEHPLRVLLVEPDPRASEMLKLGLTRAGFEVTTVAAAEEALRELSPQNELPALVIAETAGRADGFSLCGRLRADSRTANLSVVLLAAEPDSYHREMASGVGADDYLPKPLFVQDVVAVAQLRAGRGSSQRVFELECSELPLVALVRALLAGMRSGRMAMADESGGAVFRKGKLTSCQYEGLEGPEALLKMLLLAEGEYSITLGPGLGDGPMFLGTREFCAQLLPEIRSWQRVAPLSLPLEQVLEVDFRRLVEVKAELPEGVEALLRLADGRRQVRQMVLESTLSPLIALQALTRLHALRVLRQAPALLESPRRGPTLLPLAAPRRESPESWFDELGAGDEVKSEPLHPAFLQQLNAFRIKTLVEEPVTPSLRAGRAVPQVAAVEVEDAPALPGGRPVARDDEELYFDAVFTETVQEQDEVTEPFATPLRDGKEASAGFPYGPALALLFLLGAAGLLLPRVARQTFLDLTPKQLRAAPSSPMGVASPAPEPVPARAPVQPFANLDGAAAEPPPPERSSPATRARLRAATELYESGKMAAAARVLEDLTRDHPRLPEGWLTLGLARFDAGDSNGARVAAEKAISLAPQTARAHLLLASIHYVQQDFVRVRRELQRYLELEPHGAFAEEAHQLLASTPPSP